MNYRNSEKDGKRIIYNRFNRIINDYKTHFLKNFKLNIFTFSNFSCLVCFSFQFYASFFEISQK